MSDVNVYYLGTLRCIFAAELKGGLIDETEARELCAKKYVRPTITDENTLVTPLTAAELEQIKVQFPDVATAAMSTRAQSPMVRRLSDPDGMGATPTHQAETEDLDTELWTATEGNQGALPVPFQLPGPATSHNEEGMLRVVGGTVWESHRQVKHARCSPGSTVLPSTPATRGPWSHTTSMNEDLYPAEHPFIRVLKDSDDPDETPYAATTTGFPLYKGS